MFGPNMRQSKGGGCKDHRAPALSMPSPFILPVCCLKSTLHHPSSVLTVNSSSVSGCASPFPRDSCQPQPAGRWLAGWLVGKLTDCDWTAVMSERARRGAHSSIDPSFLPPKGRSLIEKQQPPAMLLLMLRAKNFTNNFPTNPQFNRLILSRSKST